MALATFEELVGDEPAAGEGRLPSFAELVGPEETQRVDLPADPKELDRQLKDILATAEATSVPLYGVERKYDVFKHLKKSGWKAYDPAQAEYWADILAGEVDKAGIDRMQENINGIIAVPLSDEEIAQQTELKKKGDYEKLSENEKWLSDNGYPRQFLPLLEKPAPGRPQPFVSGAIGYAPYIERPATKSETFEYNLKRLPENDVFRKTVENFEQMKTEYIEEMVRQGRIEQPRKYKGWWDEMGRSLVNMGLKTYSGIFGTVATASEGAIWDREALQNLADWHYNESEKQWLSPGTGGTPLAQFTAQVIGNVIPYVAAGTTAAIVTGNPYAGFFVGFSVEGDQIYRDAKKNGLSEEDAQMLRFVGGTINGAIESMQISQIIKFTPAGKGSVRALAQAARQLSWSKIQAAGKDLTYPIVEHILRESIEETLQQAVQVGAILYSGTDMTMEEVLQQLETAAAGGAFMGIGSGTVQTAFHKDSAGKGLVKAPVEVPIRVAEPEKTLTKETAAAPAVEEPPAAIAPEVQEQIDKFSGRNRNRMETEMQQLLTESETEKDVDKLAALADRMEALDSEIEAISDETLQELDIKELHAKARKLGIDVPKGTTKTGLRRLLSGPQQILPTKDGFVVRTTLAEGQAGSAWSIGTYSTYEEALLAAAADNIRRKETAVGRAEAAVSEQKQTPQESQKAPAAAVQQEAPVQPATAAQQAGVPEQTQAMAVERAQKAGKAIYIRHDAGQDQSRGWYSRTTPPKQGDYFIVTPDGEITAATAEAGLAPAVAEKLDELGYSPGQIAKMSPQMAERVLTATDEEVPTPPAVPTGAEVPAATEGKKENQGDLIGKSFQEGGTTWTIERIHPEGGLVGRNPSGRTVTFNEQFVRDKLQETPVAEAQGTKSAMAAPMEEIAAEAEKQPWVRQRLAKTFKEDTKPRRRFKRQSTDEALQTAFTQAKETNTPRYVYGTQLGMTVETSAPPITQQHFEVLPTGEVYVRISKGQAEAAKQAMSEQSKQGRRQVLQDRIRRGEPVSNKMLEEYKGEKWADEATVKDSLTVGTPAVSVEGGQAPAATDRGRLISDQTYESAKKRLTNMDTARAGFDPQGFIDLITIGAYHFENGYRAFTAWSNKMIAEFGEAVRPQLAKLWRDVHLAIRETWSKMPPLPLGQAKAVAQKVALTAQQQAEALAQQFPDQAQFISASLKPAAVSAVNVVKTVGKVLKGLPKFSADHFVQPSLELEKRSPGAYVAVIRAIHTATDYAKLKLSEMRVEALDMNIAQVKAWFEKNFTKEQQYDFIVAFAGQPGTPDAARIQQEAFNRLPPQLQDPKVVEAVRQIAKSNYDYLVSVVGPQVHWIPDYFYGVFKNASEVDKFWKFWTSTDKFTKHKTLPSVADAIMYGQESGRPTRLRHDNYIDNLMAEYMGIARLDAMKQLRKELLAEGSAGTVKPAKVQTKKKRTGTPIENRAAKLAEIYHSAVEALRLQRLEYKAAGIRQLTQSQEALIAALENLVADEERIRAESAEKAALAFEEESLDDQRQSSEAEASVSTIDPEDSSFYITEDPEVAPVGWGGVADPVFRGAWLRPDLARLINNLTSTNKVTQSKVLNPIRQFNNMSRLVSFFGSLFHLYNITSAAIADSGSYLIPSAKPFRGLIRSTQKGLDAIRATPEYKRLLKLGEGLGYSFEEDAQATFQKFTDYIEKKNFVGAAGQLIIDIGLKIPSWFQHWQFDIYIPMLKHIAILDQWRALEERTGREATDGELIDIIKATQNIYGEMNERLLGRSGTMTTGSRFAMKAPGFAEGNVRTNIDAAAKWTKWSGERGFTRGKRARTQIANTLLLKRIIAVTGTLFLTGHWPKRPERKEDFRDLFKIDTGRVDGRGRRIMIDTFGSEKDYFELWFNVFTLRPDKAIYGAFKRLGGMKSILAEFVYDGFTSMMGQKIRDWKGDPVFSLSDTVPQKLWEYMIIGLERQQPIAVSVYGQMRYKEIGRIQSFLGAISGMRPTLSEYDKREGAFLRMIYEQKADLEVLDIEILGKANPRRAYERYNEAVDRILEAKLLPEGFKERYGPELYRDVDEYLENKAEAASHLGVSDKDKAVAERSVKILKHFGIPADEAVKLRRRRRQRLQKQALEKKYSQTAREFVIRQLEQDSAVADVLRNKRLRERLGQEGE